MPLTTSARVASRIGANVDTTYIEDIATVEWESIRPVLGSGLYNGIIASGWSVSGVSASGLNPIDATLIDDYLVPWVEYECAQRSIINLNFHNGNAGTHGFNIDSGVNEGRVMQRDNFKSTAETYKQRTVDYLEQYATRYTAWTCGGKGREPMNYFNLF